MPHCSQHPAPTHYFLLLTPCLDSLLVAAGSTTERASCTPRDSWHHPAGGASQPCRHSSSHAPAPAAQASVCAFPLVPSEALCMCPCLLFPYPVGSSQQPFSRPALALVPASMRRRLSCPHSVTACPFSSRLALPSACKPYPDISAFDLACRLAASTPCDLGLPTLAKAWQKSLKNKQNCSGPISCRYVYI